MVRYLSPTSDLWPKSQRWWVFLGRIDRMNSPMLPVHYSLSWVHFFGRTKTPCRLVQRHGVCCIPGEETQRPAEKDGRTPLQLVGRRLVQSMQDVVSVAPVPPCCRIVFTSTVGCHVESMNRPWVSPVVAGFSNS